MPAPSSSARHRPVAGPGAQAPAAAGRADADETLKPEGAADGGRRQEDGAVDELLDVAVGALGGARRDGQHAMARAVAESLRSGEHLLVQAGTGTGKSLGYLVPAVRHAVHTDERVVVSTATLALQRQVLTRDLPLVADALAPHLPRRPDVALLKGWHNYLCLHKVDGGYPADDQGSLFDLPEKAGAAEHPSAGASGPGALGQQVLRLREWAEQTDSGDRDDLVPGVSDRAWRQVSVTSLECLGSACPKLDECFPERARGLAREADVVVTNHAMLGIAASGSPNVLPEHQVLVVDEAHELADRVTTQATVELSLPVVQHAARVARRNGAPSTDLEAAGEALAAVLVPLREGRFPNGLPTEVHDAVAAVRDAARTLLSLAMVAEVVHGAPSRFADPARFSLAHGGKDGHPFPVPLKVYDETIRVMKRAVDAAKLGSTDRLHAIRRLDEEARRIDRTATSMVGPTLDEILANERAKSKSYGGRTAFDQEHLEPTPPDVIALGRVRT